MNGSLVMNLMGQRCYNLHFICQEGVWGLLLGTRLSQIWVLVSQLWVSVYTISPLSVSFLYSWKHSQRSSLHLQFVIPRAKEWCLGQAMGISCHGLADVQYVGRWVPARFAS